MDLDSLRQKIDEIDSQLLQLFTQRMQACEAVAKIKKAEGMTVFDAMREKSILGRVESTVPSPLTYYATSFYSYLMELSKSRQREIIASGRTNEYFKSLLSSLRKPVDAPGVAVQGAAGSYAMSAALRMYPDARITHLPNWEDVLYAVVDGSCDYGVLPVENSAAGSVSEVYDLLIRHKQYIVKALPLPVDHYLMGVRGAKLSDIRYVYSHVHVFPQCADFFHKHRRLQKVAYPNTAVAAEYVAKTGNKTYAAIASKDCAHIYGLDILASSIQQNSNNVTRFVSVSRYPEIPLDANKISCVFTLPHVTGSLYRTLARFALAGLNLQKIESRPNTNKNFEYFFYIDFTGSIRNENILSLLAAFSEELPSFSFLGNYHEPSGEPA